MSYKKIFVANDHAGLSLKEHLKSTFSHEPWEDLGAFDTTSVDYPDFTAKVCQSMAENPDTIGVLICGSGQGMAMAANKFSHIRAALCWTKEVAQLAREHNDANVLCLGERLLTSQAAEEIFKTFITTPFAGGRHQRRVDKIMKANQ